MFFSVFLRRQSPHSSGFGYFSMGGEEPGADGWADCGLPGPRVKFRDIPLWSEKVFNMILIFLNSLRPVL